MAKRSRYFRAGLGGSGMRHLWVLQDKIQMTRNGWIDCWRTFTDNNEGNKQDRNGQAIGDSINNTWSIR